MSNNWSIKHPGILIIHQKLPRHEVGRHSHKEHEFFFPIQGHISVKYKDVNLTSGPGRTLYVPPDIEHSFSSSAEGTGERIVLLIDDNVWTKGTDKTYAATSFPIHSLAKEILYYLMVRKEVPGIKHFISALIEALIEGIEAQNQSQNDLQIQENLKAIVDPRIKKSLEAIENRQFNIAEISETIGMSPRNFSRLFTEAVGIAPKEFVIHRKIDMAKNLLVKTNQTVTDISLEVGYQSLSKFITLFKKHTGQIPSDFRAQNRHK
jgi:AraC-like DNA-binding protein